MRIEPFKIAIPEAAIGDLRERLGRTRWPDQPRGVGWQWGADLGYIRDLVGYWQSGFDWRRQEAALNRLPQFTAQLDGHRIHFVHQRGVGPDPMPLIMTHGWPGSFAEMIKIIPLLADPAAHGGDPRDAFHVIVPSLPGYGFSSRPTDPGMTIHAIAELWSKLMAGLGYDRFAAQGGDWGAYVTSGLAKLYPARLIGIHVNYVPAALLPTIDEPDLTQAEKDYLARLSTWRDLEGGYGHIQGTKPQTLSYGLTDSPAGLAAWIVEKFRGWSDCKGDVERVFSKDMLLTIIAIYWFTETIGSSIRLYRENRLHPFTFLPGERLSVPVGVACLPFEIPLPPRGWVERFYNVTRWTELPRGGHFAAFEEPHLLAEDMRSFFRPLRNG